jgi:hypothetical protein
MTSAVAGAGFLRSRAFVALLLFFGLFGVYLANTTVLDEGDAVPSINLPVALLSTGRLSFDPDNFPELFKWKTHPPFIEKDDFFFTSWDDEFGDRTAREWRKTGQLELNGPRYYIVPAPLRNTYVSTFGPIPGLLMLPFAAPFYAIDHAFVGKLALRASVAKLGSASFVALTAVLLFLIADHLASRRRALFASLTYALGTCAWAISSQNIWQQTVNQLFLAAGAYFVVSGVARWPRTLLAGFFLGAATACRPTSGCVVFTVLLYLYLTERRGILPFALGVLPVPLGVLAYNLHYFGNPFTFAQAIVGQVIAFEKTGSSDVWQTPFLYGALGLLISPSRGLLVFSPILGLAFWGFVRAIRDDDYRILWPFFASALFMMAAQCKWFDWWGGHAYGYRPWLDAVPYLSLGLLPIAGDLFSTKMRATATAAALAWSVFVQALGAMSYDRYWNLRRVFVIRVPTHIEALDYTDEEAAKSDAERYHGSYIGPSYCDIDYTFCRHRLWSLNDNLILYQSTHFTLSRDGRLPFGFSDLGH